MPKMERVREFLQGPLDEEHLNQRAAAGWHLCAVEWERPVFGEEDRPFGSMETELPYGLQVSSDCMHLVENRIEKDALVLMLELIVQDYPFSRISSELNERGYRTRSGGKWDPVSVFNLLPRMIEIGPRVFTSEEWADRRQQLFKVLI